MYDQCTNNDGNDLFFPRLAENAHDIWAKKKKEEIESTGKNQ